MSSAPALRPIGQRDRGAVLPLVLVVAVVLALVMVAAATFTTTTLRYGQVSESRADRFAAAQAAMNNAIERLETGLSACATGVPVEVMVFPVVINEAPASVECRHLAGDAGTTDGWAVVVTAEGDPTYDLQISSGGGADKYIGGKIWMERLGHFRIQSQTYAQGDLWYPGVCTTPERTNLTIDSQFDFEPGYSTVCSDSTWTVRFPEPHRSVPTVASATDPNGAFDALTGCTVFEPGLYVNAPNLGDFNYFKSGVYHFEDVGVITVKQKRVLFGNMAGLEGFPSIENAPCNTARGLDTTDGATVYVSGSTRFNVETDGSLEFSRRDQIGARHDRVSLHVIDAGAGGQPTWNDPVVSTDAGNNKELAVQGLVYAPYAGFEFAAVTNDTTAVLRGGAVVAALDANASASASGFLIEVPTSSSRALIQLTATATKDAELKIRTMIDWRLSNNETAIQSWRVCEESTC